MIESKGRSIVPTLIFSQSPIVYVKMRSFDWLEMSPGQRSALCSQRDIRVLPHAT